MRFVQSSHEYPHTIVDFVVSCARAREVAVKVHAEIFAAALSMRSIMEAWGSRGAAKGFHSTAYPRRHETPFLDWNAEFRFAESRFSQPLYQ